MKVLFVAGGNSGNFEIPPLIKAQGESLNKLGINVIYFSISGRGVFGYLKNAFSLRKTTREDNIDLIHAHYSYSGLLAKMSCISVPLVVSFMGSDVMGNGILKKTIIKLEKILFGHNSIVKSKELNDRKSIQSVVIPNGVNLEKFQPLSQCKCRNELGWSAEKKHILFAANPSRPEKNIKLTIDSIRLLSRQDLELHYLDHVDHNEMATWFNAADVVVLSSLWEGSPNVIKEAMSCNRPIVSTNVGDVKWLFGELDGHYISRFIPLDFSEKINFALEFATKHRETGGRKRIMKLGLDDLSVAKKIYNVYEQVIS